MPPRAPLISMSVVEWPFDGVALDIVGPFPKSTTGYHFVLVILDYATRYPEAVPMRSITTPKVAEELIKWISRMGIPQERVKGQML